MMLCDYVIFEEKSRKPTLVGCFTNLRIRHFPRRLLPFSLFTAVMYSRPARPPMYLQQFPLRKPPDLVLPKPKKEKPARGKGRRKKK
jgi:hypothetical protein